MASIRKRSLKTGKISYEVRVHRAGHPDLSKSFPSMAEAKAWGNDVEARIDKGATIARKAKNKLIRQIIEEYRHSIEQPIKKADDKKAADESTTLPSTEKKASKAKLPKLSATESNQLATVANDFGDYAVGSLTHYLVGNYIAKLQETKIAAPENRKKLHYLYKGDRERTYSLSSVRKFYYQLKKVVEWHARKNSYILPPNLFTGHNIPAAWEGVRERRLEAGEEEKLYQSARLGQTQHEAWICIIGFAIETGMRAQEILKARWSDLNLPGRTLNIPKEHVKTKAFRQIPLSRRAVEILQQMEKLKHKGEDRIFHQWPSSLVLSRGFRRICHRAAVDDLKFHDLRHEATSRFFEKGRLSDMEIMKITGHKSYTTLERYAKLRPSTLADKLD